MTDTIRIYYMNAGDLRYLDVEISEPATLISSMSTIGPNNAFSNIIINCETIVPPSG